MCCTCRVEMCEPSPAPALPQLWFLPFTSFMLGPFLPSISCSHTGLKLTTELRVTLIF